MKRTFLFITFLSVIHIGIQAQQRVTGGLAINITEAPWSVILKTSDSYDHCTGSIIAPNAILTAKHCVVGHSPSSLQVVAGVRCKSEANSSNTYNVSEIITHPTLDVAILKLSSNIPDGNSSRAVNYLSASNPSFYTVGNSVRVSGWGWLTPDGYDAANCLNAVNLHIISNTNAQAAMGLTVHDYEVAATGVGSVRQGSCHGDSGGPLVTLDSPNNYVLIGVVSWGISHCLGNNTNSPSIFVRVSSIVDWISANLSTIVGTSYISGVGTSATYSIQNLPVGATVTWNRSSNLNISGSNTGSSKTFISNATGAAWVEASIAINGTAYTLPRKNITICYDISGTFSQPGASTQTLSSTNYYSATGGTYLTATLQNISGVSYSWTNPTSTGNTKSFTVYDGYSTTVTLSTSNCSRSATLSFTADYSGSGGGCVAPYNPNDGTITIIFDNESSALATETAALRSTASPKQTVVAPKKTYKAYLYNTQGVLVKQQNSQGEAITWNIAAQPTGVYVVQVIDESGKLVFSNKIVKN